MGLADDIIKRNKDKRPMGYADRVIQNKDKAPLFFREYVSKSNKDDYYYDELESSLRDNDLRRYEAKNRGTKHLRENTGVNPNIFLKKDRRNQSTPLERTNRDIIADNMKTEEYRLANNDYVMDKYELNKHNVDTNKIGFGDKLYDSTLAGALSLLDLESNKYVDDNGNETYLPSKQDMLHQKVQESYKDNFGGMLGKFINDIGYESSKIIGAKGLDVLAGGAPVGSGLYYKKIFTDSYEEAMNEGFDHNNSVIYATTIGSLDAILDKLTGGVNVGTDKLLSKMGKKGGIKSLSDAIFDKLRAIGIKPTVSKIVSKGFGEGGQEFIEEFLENFSKLIFLKNSTDISDYTDVLSDPDVWSDALYAGAVGAFIGAGAGAMDKSGKNPTVEDATLNAFEKQLEKTKENKTPKKKAEIEKIQSEIQKLREEKNGERNSEYYKNKKKKIEKVIEKTSKEETETIKKLEKAKELVDKEIKKQELIEEATPIEEEKPVEKKPAPKVEEEKVEKPKVEKPKFSTKDIESKTNENISKSNYKDKTEWVDIKYIDDVKEFDREKNPKTDLDKLEKDIIENGFKEPLTISFNPKTGNLKLGEGNHRLAVAKRLGLEKVPVRALRSQYMEDGVKYVNPKGITPYQDDDVGVYYYDEMTPSLLGKPFGKDYVKKPKVEEKPKVETKPVESPVKEEKPAESTEKSGTFTPSKELEEKYNKLTPFERKKADEVISLRNELKTLAFEDKPPINAKLNRLTPELTKNASQYVSQYTREKLLFEKELKVLSKEEIEKKDKETFAKEYAKIDNEEKSKNKSNEETKTVHKLNDVYYFAKQQYYDYIRTGISEYKDEAMKYYNEYKNRNGRKIIEGLESKPEEKIPKNPNISASKKEPVLVIKNENIDKPKKSKSETKVPRGVSMFNERVKETEKSELNEEEYKEIDRIINYDVKTNKEVLKNSSAYISKVGYNTAVKTYIANYESNQKVTADTIGIGQTLLNTAIQNRDTKTVRDLLGIVTLQLTEGGQVAQAGKLFKYVSKERAILTLQKQINNLQNNNVKGSEDLKLTDSMINEINSVEDGDVKGMQEAFTKVEKELATQLRGTIPEKLQTWRYFSMLSSPATHIRNILSNVVMYNVLIKSKDINANMIEKIVKKYNPDIFEQTDTQVKKTYSDRDNKQLLNLKKRKIDLLNKKATKENYIENYNKVIDEIKDISGEYRIEAIYEQKNIVAYNLKQLENELDEALTKRDELKVKRYGEQGSEIRTELGNLSTEINSMQISKKKLNKINNTLTGLLPNGYASKSLKKMTSEIKGLSKIYYENNKNSITQTSKYKSSQGIETMKSIFGKKIVNDDVINNIKNRKLNVAKKMIIDNLLDGTDLTENKAKKIANVAGNVLETIVQINYDLLEVEDNMSKSLIYKRAFGKMLMANGIDEQVNKIKRSKDYKLAEDKQAYLNSKLLTDNPALFSQANDYAINQALEGTFQQYNAVASWLNKASQLKKKGAFEKLPSIALDIVLPFKTTTFNIAKTAYEYSPVGVLGDAVFNLKKLKSGEMTATAYIDSLAKGLVGTELMILGYGLRNLGVLTGDDDEEYGINVGDKIVTLDWMAPSAPILFTGARIADLLDELDSKEDMTMNEVIGDTLSLFKPYVDMSIIESIIRPMDDYKYGGEQGLLESLIVDYMGQYLPTIGGSFNKFIDPVIRTTSPSKNSPFKLGEMIRNTIYYKTPFLSNKLEPRLDEWGNEELRRGNAFVRAYDAFIAPYKVKEIEKKTVEGLSDLYQATNDDGLLPTKFDGNIRYKDTTYKTSSAEKTKYQKTFGKNVARMINEVNNSEYYEKLSNKDKSVVINKIYEYGNYLAKKEYFDEHNIDFESSTSERYGELESAGLSVVDYLSIRQQINRLPKDDRPTISNDQLKSILHAKIPIDTYLDFKMRIKDIKGDPDLNSDVEGKTIPYTKKRKILEQVVKTKGLTVEQKLLLTYLSGNSISNGDYRGITKNDARRRVFDYINSLPISVEDKRNLLEDSGYTILKNGKIRW